MAPLKRLFPFIISIMWPLLFCEYEGNYIQKFQRELSTKWVMNKCSEYRGPRAAGEDPTEPHAGPPNRQFQALLEGTGHVAALLWTVQGSLHREPPLSDPFPQPLSDDILAAHEKEKVIPVALLSLLFRCSITEAQARLAAAPSVCEAVRSALAGPVDHRHTQKSSDQCAPIVLCHHCHSHQEDKNLTCRKTSKQDKLEYIQQLTVTQLEDRTRMDFIEADVTCISELPMGWMQEYMFWSIDRSLRRIFQHLENARIALMELNLSESQDMTASSISSDLKAQEVFLPCCYCKKAKHSTDYSISSGSTNHSPSPSYLPIFSEATAWHFQSATAPVYPPQERSVSRSHLCPGAKAHPHLLCSH